MVAKVVDLRPGRTPARVPRDQGTLFAPRPPKKPLPLRARRRRARLALLALLSVLLLASVYAIHVLSYLPALTIATVDVAGAHTLSPAEVEAFVSGRIANDGDPYLSRANIFGYPRAALERSLVANFPRISSAALSRPSLFSRTLTVAVTERTPFARWCLPAATSAAQAGSDAQNCFVMDAGGFIFAASDASTTPSDYAEPYFFFGGTSTSSSPVGQTFISGHLSGLLALLATLSQQTGLAARSVVVESTQDFTVRFTEGFDLKASFGEEAQTLARNLKLVLNSDALSGKEGQLDYVDLRFGDKVYYKLKGDTATSSAAR